MGTAFSLKLCGAILILPLLALAVQFTGNDAYTNGLVFIIASATLFHGFNVIDFYFQSQVLSKYVAQANAIRLFFYSIFKVLLILLSAPLIAFAAMTLVNALVLAAGLLYFYTRVNHLNPWSWKFEWHTARHLLQDSWPLLLSALAVTAYMKIDQIMIKEMIDAEAVGQYAAAVHLSEAWYFIPIAVTSSLFPAILHAKKQDPAVYQQRLRHFYTLMIWLAIGVAVPISFCSSWPTQLLYGIQYHRAGDVLMIHIWAGVFVFLAVASGKYLLAENLVMKAFHRHACGLGVMESGTVRISTASFAATERCP